MNHYTWTQALTLWSSSPEVVANHSLLKNANTALKKYVVPGLIANVEKLTSDEFATYCQKTSVFELQNALSIFDTRFSAAVALKQISKGTRRTYRWPLSRFLEWLEQQIWYKELFPEPIDLPMPAHHGVTVKPSRGKRKRAKAYALKIEQLSPMAAKELRTLEEFWTKKGREAKRARRGEKHVRLSTFKDMKQYHILCFYGWYVNIEGHSLDELRLSLFTDVSLSKNTLIGSLIQGDVIIRRTQKSLRQRLVLLNICLKICYRLTPLGGVASVAIGQIYL